MQLRLRVTRKNRLLLSASLMCEARMGAKDPAIAVAVVVLLLGTSLRPAVAADPFTFSGAEQQEQKKQQEAEAQRALAIQQLVSVPCRERLKNHKILQLVGERSGSEWLTRQDRYQQLRAIIDARLQALGLRTYTPEQITAAIAQAELDAYFNNDPDAALSASKRLAADYILRGDITTKAGVNPVVGVNEVAVDVELVLTSASGREISRVDARADAYSGHDVPHAAAVLMQQQADQLVAQLYNDFCRKAAVPEHPAQ
jgi:hypothetical protein